MTRVLIIIGVFATVLALMAIVMMSLGEAHMHDRADLDTWFSSLRDKAGASCCSVSDATTIKDPDWDSIRDADGDVHYRVQMFGDWLVVPDDKVLSQSNKYGPALVWFWRDNGMIKIRCFMPGAGT